MRQILHISDIHFGPHFRPQVAEGVSALIEQRRPDLVVISGDLTQRAKIVQFQDARRWIDSFPVPHIVVPGNHDVPMYRVWERALSPFATYRQHFSEELEPVWQDDRLFVVGVNSAYNWTVKDGRITRSALRRLDEVLASAPADRVKMVVAHHPMVPPPRFDTRRLTRGAIELAALLQRHRVDMALSGHLHQTWIGSTEEYFPRGQRPVFLLHTGTTTSGRGRGWEKKRNSCNWLRIEEQRFTVSHLLWQPEQTAFVEWSRHTYPLQSNPNFALEP